MTQFLFWDVSHRTNLNDFNHPDELIKWYFSDILSPRVCHPPACESRREAIICQSVCSRWEEKRLLSHPYASPKSWALQSLSCCSNAKSPFNDGILISFIRFHITEKDYDSETLLRLFPSMYNSEKSDLHPPHNWEERMRLGEWLPSPERVAGIQCILSTDQDAKIFHKLWNRYRTRSQKQAKVFLVTLDVTCLSMNERTLQWRKCNLNIQ